MSILKISVNFLNEQILKLTLSEETVLIVLDH